MIEERFSMDGRRAVVTGGGGGFGRAFCLILAEAGAEVVAVDIDGGEAETTASAVTDAGGVALAIECDVADHAEVEGLSSELAKSGSGVDVLINNAGNSPPSRKVADIPVEEWDDVISVNLRSAFLCSRYLIPLMLGGDDPSIINVASVLGMRGFHPEVISQAGYAASKAGMIGLTLQTAADYGEQGLRANAVAPGWHLGTNLSKRAGNFATPEQEARLQQTIHQRIPLQRASNAEELAPLILYLASSASRFVSGSVLTHDGGWTAI
ncbi:MAG: SDR family oxidoreductase [bacterium]|nr:SDR family oxidoreductase [bacterium]MCY3579330.1 SDR family oxidoreductase [bacterium]